MIDSKHWTKHVFTFCFVAILMKLDITIYVRMNLLAWAKWHENEEPASQKMFPSPTIYLVALCHGRYLNSLTLNDGYVRQYTSHTCFTKWVVACSTPNYYLNWYWIFVNSTFQNTLQIKCHHNSKVTLLKVHFKCLIQNVDNMFPPAFVSIVVQPAADDIYENVAVLKTHRCI